MSDAILTVQFFYFFLLLGFSNNLLADQQIVVEQADNTFEKVTVEVNGLKLTGGKKRYLLATEHFGFIRYSFESGADFYYDLKRKENILKISKPLLIDNLAICKGRSYYTISPPKLVRMNGILSILPPKFGKNDYPIPSVCKDLEAPKKQDPFTRASGILLSYKNKYRFIIRSNVDTAKVYQNGKLLEKVRPNKAFLLAFPRDAKAVSIELLKQGYTSCLAVLEIASRQESIECPLKKEG